jgi:hypothetical protein
MISGRIQRLLFTGRNIREINHTFGTFKNTLQKYLAPSLPSAAAIEFSGNFSAFVVFHFPRFIIPHGPDFRDRIPFDNSGALRSKFLEARTALKIS